MASDDRTHAAPIHPARRWFRTLLRILRAIGERNLTLVAAGVAFFVFLSIFPLLAAALSIWGLFADPELLREGVDDFATILPPAASAILSDRLQSVAVAPSERLGLATFISLAFALFSARAGVAALTTGLNAVYGESARRNPITAALKAILITTILILMGLVAVASALIVPAVVAYVDPGPSAVIVVTALRWAIGTALLLFGLGLLYRYAPSRRPMRTGWITPGAVIALILWILASIAVSIYIARVADLNALYGSIGAVIALMLWLFVSAFSILLGALVNAELENAES
ncbi:MAG: YihY/virulence factor BrkB family protein [Pseudomonadota bacterium]